MFILQKLYQIYMITFISMAINDQNQNAVYSNITNHIVSTKQAIKNQSTVDLYKATDEKTMQEIGEVLENMNHFSAVYEYNKLEQDQLQIMRNGINDINHIINNLEEVYIKMLSSKTHTELLVINKERHKIITKLESIANQFKRAWEACE